MDRAEAAGARCAARASRRRSTRSRSTGSRSRRSKRHRTGTSRGRSGGATSCPIWYCANGHVICAETTPDACTECGSTELTRETDVLDTWFSSALWPFATLGWPDETPDLAAFYPGHLQTTARDIIRLWENRMIFAGLELIGRHPVHGRDHPLDRARARRTADVEEPRHRHRPARRDRAARNRRDAVRPAEDLLGAGRALLVQRDRGGTPAREQALEREPSPAAGCGRRGRAAAVVARGAVDPRPSRCGARRFRGRPRGVRFLPRGRPSVPPDVRRLLRLVSRVDQAPARRGRRRRRRRSRRSSGCSRSSIP